MNRIGEALCAALREDTPAPPALTPDDWRAVGTLAIRQRVGPLLLSRKHLPFPADVRAQLRARAETSAKRVLMQQAAFRELAGRVAPLGVSLIALKGLHLATAVYRSPVLREMNDIDVMVRPEQVESVSEVVRALGYTALSEVPVAIALKAAHHVPRFLRGEVELEVHWRLARTGESPTVEPNLLWSNACPLPLAPNAMCLAPEDLLVHVCVHAAAAHHFEQGIRPLCDVLAMVNVWRGTLDWDGVVARAHAWHCDRSVALVLTLAQSKLCAPVPAEVLAKVADARPAAAVVDLAWTQALSDTGLIYETPVAAGQLLQGDSIAGKLRHLLSRIRLPGDEMATWYPGVATSRLAYAWTLPKRVVDLVRRHGWSLLKAAVRRQSPERLALDRRNALTAWLRGR